MKNKIKKEYYLIVFAFILGLSFMYIFMNNKNNKTIIYEKSLSSSIKKIYDSVVVIQNIKNNQKNGLGSGFIYKTDNNYAYILTNEHVISDAEEVEITLSSDKVESGTILGKDAYLDLAVIRISKKNIKQIAKLGSSEKMEIGDTVFTIGTPLEYNYRGTVTSGILSGKNRMVETKTNNNGWLMRVIQIDASINSGNSGGPVANINGEVIGITTLKLVDKNIEGMGFAIPIEYATSHLEQLENGKEIEWPSLGISVIDTSDSRTLAVKEITIPNDVNEGAVVTGINNKNIEKNSKLKIGDIIIKVNNYQISNSTELKYQVFQYKKGDTITITYIRNNKQRTTKIKLQ